jgi:hypothetical protein
MMKLIAKTFTVAALGLFSGTALALAIPSHAAAQSQQSSASANTPSVPSEAILARLVWSTMIALDNANRTGNYSVLYALGSPTFKQQNSPQQLFGNFASLRQNRIDVGRTIFLSPTYYIPPAILPDGSLRLRGGFEDRAKSVRFDLIYSNSGGGWQISAISVVEMAASSPR